jgi:hypothetical protein
MKDIKALSDQVRQTVCRLIDPGSEWRLHREWFDKSAMAGLLGADYRLATDDTFYRCLDQLIDHKPALFSHSLPPTWLVLSCNTVIHLLLQRKF